MNTNDAMSAGCVNTVVKFTNKTAATTLYGHNIKYIFYFHLNAYTTNWEVTFIRLRKAAT